MWCIMSLPRLIRLQTKHAFNTSMASSMLKMIENLQIISVFRGKPYFQGINYFFPLKKIWTLGRGINREDFDFKLAIFLTCSTWPLLNKNALKNKVGLQTPPLPRTPCIAYGKGQKIENFNFIFAVVKMYSN